MKLLVGSRNEITINKADPIDVNNSPIKNIEIIYNSSNCII